ncbi:MAG: S41 family peptidase [Roseburia sp.]|nr:S41 family peptidase [Roseburia sp.]
MEENKHTAGEKDEFFDAPPAPAPEGSVPKKKNRAKAIAIAVGAAVLAVVCFFAGWLSYYYSLDEGLRTFLWAKKTTEKNYYKEIDSDALYDDLMEALEGQVDRYSRFYTRDEYAQIVRESEGENEGIGISVTEEEGIPRLYTVVGNSPAYLAGLKSGMYVSGFGLQEGELQTGNVDGLFAFLDGQKGEFTLRCGFEKDGSDGRLYNLKKRVYLASYCTYFDSDGGTYYASSENGAELTATAVSEGYDAPLLLNGKTAYIRLDEFNGRADEEFQACLELMKEKKRETLILDLRGNGGGYMTTLCSIASHLMKNATESRPVVATAKYRNGKNETFRADGNDYGSYFGENSRIVLLADNGTASASECLIGAMIDYGTVSSEDIFLRRDWDGAEARTYGKGIMQSHFPNLSGDVMKLTVATVHWPLSGNCIQDIGVKAQDEAHAYTTSYLQKGDPMLAYAIGQIA